MTIHLRTQIKDIVKEALRDNGVDVINSIFRGLDDEELPKTYVDIIDASFELTAIGDIAMTRSFELSTTTFLADVEGVDERIDEIMVLIEKAIINHEKLNDKTHASGFSIIRHDKLPNLKIADLKIANQVFNITVLTSLDGIDFQLAAN